jgi:uracil DNA glycosylase/ribonuclease HI
LIIYQINMSLIYDESILDTINYEWPKKEYIFNALNMTNIKVVIIGDQPYPNANSHGYAFSSLNSLTSELKAIFKAVGYKGTNGNLQSWVDQGVMLLNTYLTYPDRPAAWKPLIHDILVQVAQKFPKCCFVLWGKSAKGLEKIISPNKVFTYPHTPSDEAFAFDFKPINEYLKEAYTIKDKSKALNTFLSPCIIWDPDTKPQKQVVVAFTDGSFRGKNSKAGWAAHFPKEIYGLQNAVSGYRRSPLVGTNIDAEGMAIFKTFDIFKWCQKTFYADFRFIVITDSEFWMKTILGEYKVGKKEELFNKIMNMVKFPFDIYFIPSHGKPVKSIIPYRNFNGVSLTVEQAWELVAELVEGNKAVDKLAGELTE